MCQRQSKHGILINFVCGMKLQQNNSSMWGEGTVREHHPIQDVRRPNLENGFTLTWRFTKMLLKPFQKDESEGLMQTVHIHLKVFLCVWPNWPICTVSLVLIRKSGSICPTAQVRCQIAVRNAQWTLSRHHIGSNFAIQLPVCESYVPPEIVALWCIARSSSWHVSACSWPRAHAGVKALMWRWMRPITSTFWSRQSIVFQAVFEDRESGAGGVAETTAAW